mgnify:CR=1 FL=1|tara:strand:+ start:1176 stop:1415 length:240 start_codon:yes stop_codon:yes gene_type:complete
MEISKKLVQDVHRIVNEGNKPLTTEMKKKVEERAFELADKHTNVDQDKVEKILERMAMSGDDLNDLEALENELSALGTN